MPGGPEKAYEVVKPIFEAVAAKVGDQPCVTYIGPGSAGHYVKMVHNGIEYGLMQLISESYDLMKRGLGLSNDELAEVYEAWNKAELNSFLLEITVDIFRKEDDKGGGRIIDLIRGAARQKGTGMWTSQTALELGVPIPTIDVAVAMRSMSDYERGVGSELLTGPKTEYTDDKKQLIAKLGNSLYIGFVTTYAQGMDLLRVASNTYEHNLNLVDIASIWRGGCIIRSTLLQDIRLAFQNKINLPNLILDTQLSKLLSQKEADLRTVVATATQLGIPVPGLMMSLAYYDTWRSSWLPANLIQAQRDYFGAHTYQRLDMEGVFHTEWEKE
jgi:6-phosphogluconate dehydrogenase